jgi:hypothetical protein
MTKNEINLGKIDKGGRIALNRASETNALFALRTLFESIITKVTKLARETCK